MAYYDLKNLSQITSLSVFTLRKFIKHGLPHYVVGRKYLVDLDEFKSWFENYHSFNIIQKDRNFSSIINEEISKYKA
jgi:hypothetical protein